MAADPQWLRSTLCEDLADMDRAAGRVPDTRAIEAVVDEDIRLWAAQSREAKPVTAKPQKQADDRQHEAAKRIANEREVEFRHNGPVQDEAPRKLCPCGGSACKHCKMRLRLAALMEPLPLKERKHLGPQMHHNCRYPAFAKEIIDVWSWMTFAKRAKVHRKKGELEAVVMRKLEDICDRSTAIIGLGPWWVK